MIPDPKALKEARLYIPERLREVFFDSSDSGEAADRHLARFEVLTDDKIEIGDFIREHLMDEYCAQAAGILSDEGEDIETREYVVVDITPDLDEIRVHLASKAAD